MKDAREVIRQLSKDDGRYAPEAFSFVFESLDPAVRLAGREDAEGAARHVTGQELLAGLRAEARRQFGPLGAHVWRTWGVHQCVDWGHIVFLLVDGGLLNRREEDSLEDFREDFDFDAYFVQDYPLVLPAEIGPAGARGEG